MNHVRGVLRSVWTIVGGLALMALGALVFSLGAPEDYGWFTYFSDAEQQVPTLTARFGTEQLVGLALVALGLVLTAAAVGFRLGALGGASASTLPEGPTG